MTAPTGMDLVGVVDIGGSHVTAAVVGFDTRGPSIHRRERLAIDARGSRAMLLDALAMPALQLLGEGCPASWTIALPGPFDYDRGIGTFEGVDKFQSLSGVHLRRELSARWGIDPGRVRFVNDGVAYGIGEWAEGTTGRPRRMLCLTLGTGVGSAFLDQGRAVSSGPGVPRDGDVHTLLIDGRPLEETMSSAALRARYRAASGVDLDVEGLCALARTGDAVASRSIECPLRALGRAIAPAVADFDADHVVVGGAIARSWDVIGGPLISGFAEASVLSHGVQLSPAVLQDSAPLLGAAVWRLRA